MVYIYAYSLCRLDNRGMRCYMLEANAAVQKPVASNVTGPGAKQTMLLNAR